MISNPVPWPDGARCAVCFSSDMDGESLMHAAMPDKADTRVAGLSELRYGPTVAVPRMTTSGPALPTGGGRRGSSSCPTPKARYRS